MGPTTRKSIKGWGGPDRPFLIYHANPPLFAATEPCITTAVWRCRKLINQWQLSFRLKSSGHLFTLTPSNQEDFFATKYFVFNCWLFAMFGRVSTMKSISHSVSRGFRGKSFKLWLIHTCCNYPLYTPAINVLHWDLIWVGSPLLAHFDIYCVNWCSFPIHTNMTNILRCGVM